MQEGKVNYFIGNDPKKWKTNIPTYTSVRYKEIYKGIDIKFYGNNHQMEYDIIVKPGGDPNSVKLAYEGIEGLKVTENGDLQIVLKQGSIIQKKPIIYQKINGEKVAVDGKFKIQDAGYKIQDKFLNPDLQLGTCNLQPCSYTFEVASYNKSLDLIIDPVIVWSTYLGGSGWDIGSDIAVDTDGNAYVTGYTTSLDFPIVSPIQYPAENVDVFVTKISSSGSAIVYSTYLGGNGDDYGFGIAVDTLGNAYITGKTRSTDFPVASTIQGSYVGGYGYYWGDAFVTKINSSGSAIIYSTYFDGGGDDYSYGIAVDTSENAYISVNGSVTKIDALGSRIIYSTYVGSGVATGIAVDTSGNAYITGYTESPDFPTVSPIQETKAGKSDAFVTKLDTSGSLAYSTFLGGSNWDGYTAPHLDKGLVKRVKCG